MILDNEKFEKLIDDEEQLDKFIGALKKFNK